MGEDSMKAMDATLQMTAAALAKPAPFSHPTIYDAEDPDTIHAVDRDLGGYVTVEAYDNLLIAYEELKAEKGTVERRWTLALDLEETVMLRAIEQTHELLERARRYRAPGTMRKAR